MVNGQKVEQTLKAFGDKEYEALYSIIEKHNKLAGLYKDLEQNFLCDKKLLPLLNEFRYCLRAVIDILSGFNEYKNSVDNPFIRADAALGYIYRDLIDIFSIIASEELKQLIDKYGMTIVKENFKDHKLAKYYKNLTTMKDYITETRKNREERDALYQKIESEILKESIEFYDDLNSLYVKDKINGAYEEKKRKELFPVIMIFITVISSCITVLTFIFK